ncbi:MAG: TonB-dependent receptor plug domain-containing protein, partial [Pseudomonadota bacterium]|nr:TonB-dependent receptor plug domain-containing protein [Pseudomonadota bacterium]
MSKPTLLAIALAAAIPAATLPATSLAAPSGQEAAVLSLNIPAGSLNQVLVRLAQAGGVTLSVNSSAVAGQSSAGIKGSYTLDEAFAQVLNGTGLQATQTTQGYVLEQAESQEAATAPEKALTLDKVVVTASGFEQELVDAPASISVITREDIESRYYSDVTDALRNIPGVTITGGGSGDGGTDISMRGLPSSYTLLLVDGKRQDSRESRPNGSAGFEQDWLPPMAAVERIEVVRGPMSTLYGSDAIGGVINIITRKVPQEWHGSVTLDTVLQENRDAGDIRQANIFAGGPLIQDTLGLQIFGRAYKREEDNIVNGYEEKKLNSGSAKLSYTPTSDHDIVLEAGVTKQERYGTLGRSNPTEDCGRSGCGDSESKHERKYYNLSHSGRWGFTTSDSYIQTEKTRNDGRDMEITNTVANTNWVMSFDSNILSVGAQYQEEHLEDNTSNRISDRTEIENTQWAVFAEDEWMIDPDFSLT